MLRLYLFVSFAYAWVYLSSCGETPLDQLSIAELDEHITEAEGILDSLQKMKAYKVSIDTTGRYASLAADVSHLLLADTSVLIKGRILDSLESTSISIRQDRPYQSDFSIKQNIDTDGSFKIELDIEAPGFFLLTYADRRHEIYLAPGQEMAIIYDTTEQGQLLFGGDLAEENSLLQQIDQSLSFLSHRRLADDKHEPITVSSTSVHSVSDFDSLDQLLTLAIGERRDAIDAEFLYLLEEKVRYAKARLALEAYDVDHLSLHSLDVDPDDERLFPLYHFRKFIFEYFEKKASLLLLHTQTKGIDYYTRKYELVDSIFSAEKIVDFMKTDVLYEAIARVPSTGVNALVSRYEREVSDTAFRRTINNRYSQIINPVAGTIAPEIMGTTYDGEGFRLSDHRGSYVYIFSWATWCGPCKVELPFYKRMLEDYAEANISFIGISVDKDRKKWTESFFYNDYPGLQVLVPGDWKSPFVRDYEVKSIPQFILIDPAGVILDADAQRPTKAIKAQLSTYGIMPKPS